MTSDKQFVVKTGLLNVIKTSKGGKIEAYQTKMCNSFYSAQGWGSSAVVHVGGIM